MALLAGFAEDAIEAAAAGGPFRWIADPVTNTCALDSILTPAVPVTWVDPPDRFRAFDPVISVEGDVMFTVAAPSTFTLDPDFRCIAEEDSMKHSPPARIFVLADDSKKKVEDL